MYVRGRRICRCMTCIIFTHTLTIIFIISLPTWLFLQWACMHVKNYIYSFIYTYTMTFSRALWKYSPGQVRENVLTDSQETICRVERAPAQSYSVHIVNVILKKRHTSVHLHTRNIPHCKATSARQMSTNHETLCLMSLKSTCMHAYMNSCIRTEKSSLWPCVRYSCPGDGSSKPRLGGAGALIRVLKALWGCSDDVKTKERQWSPGKKALMCATSAFNVCHWRVFEKSTCMHVSM